MSNQFSFNPNGATAPFGTGGGDPFGGLGMAPTPSKGFKKPPHHDSWWERALNTTEGALSSVFSGLVQAGQGNVNDFWNAWHGDFSFHNDATLANAIGADYENKYAKPFEDNGFSTQAFSQLASNMAKDPVGSVLDVLSVASIPFTMGGSLAVRGVALGGKAGELAAAASALTKSAELTDALRAAKASGDAAKVIKVESDIQAINNAADAASGAKGLGQRLLSGNAGRVHIADDGTVYVPKTAELHSSTTGDSLKTVPLSESPYQRVFQRAGIGTNNAIESVLGEKAIGSATNRAAKLEKRISRIQGENAAGKVLGVGGGARALRKVGKMKPEEIMANYLREVSGKAGLKDLSTADAHEVLKAYADHLTSQLDVLQRAKMDPHFHVVYAHTMHELVKENRRNFAIHGGDEAAAWLEKRPFDHQNPYDHAATIHVAGELEKRAQVRLEEQEKELFERQGKIEHDKGWVDRHGAARKDVEYDRPVLEGPHLTGFRGSKHVYVEARDAKGRPLTERVATDVSPMERLQHNIDMLPNVSERIAKTKSAIRALQKIQFDAQMLEKGGFERMVAEHTDMAKAVHDATQLHAIETELKARAEMALMDRTAEVFAAPTKVMLQVEKAHRAAAEFTTGVLKKEMGVAVRSDRPEMLAERFLGRKLTPEELDNVIVRPHERIRERGKGVKNRKRAKPPAPADQPGFAPGFSKHSTGYNFRFAQDSMSPAMVFKSWNEARAFKVKMGVLNEVQRVGRRVTGDEPLNPGEIRLGGDTKLVDKARALEDKLNGELKMMAGGNPMFDNATTELQAILSKVTDDAQAWAVPEHYFNILSAEITKSTHFLTRLIDAPTSVFRAATLNLRPAWMVNNLVGQLMLLTYSQGVLHGLREYGLEVGRAVQRADQHPVRDLAHEVFPKTRITSAPDAQVDTLYGADRRMLKETKVGHIKGGQVALQKRADEIVQSGWWQRHFPHLDHVNIVVDDLKNPDHHAVTNRLSNTIRFRKHTPYNAHSDQVLIHEMAHLATHPRHAWHGPEYAANHLAIAHAFRDSHTVDAMRRIYDEEGVQIAPKFGNAIAEKVGAPSIKQQLNTSTSAMTMGSHNLASELGAVEESARNSVGLGSLLEWTGFRRVRNQAGEAEGSLAAHTAAIFLKAMPVSAANLVHAMGKINAIVTDDLPRRAAFMGAVRPRLKEIMRRTGVETPQEALQILLGDDKSVAWLIDRTMSDMIDYGRMSDFERNVIRRVLPFYSWMKGMTVRTVEIGRDKPGIANVSYKVGSQYAETAKQRFGSDMPGSLVGSFLVHGGKNPQIVPTAGLNPFQTPADILGMLASGTIKGGPAFGPDHPLGQINPVFKSPLEVMLGTDLFTGASLYGKKGKQGPFDLFDQGVKDNPYTPQDEGRSGYGAAMSRYLASLGPLGMYLRYTQAQKTDQSVKMLPRDQAQILLSYLGYNATGLNTQKAQSVYDAAGNRQEANISYDPTKGEVPIVVGGSHKHHKKARAKPSQDMFSGV